MFKNDVQRELGKLLHKIIAIIRYFFLKVTRYHFSLSILKSNSPSLQIIYIFF